MGNTIFNFDTDRAWDYENGYYLTSHITRFAKALAHYELYKMIVDLPGHIVECGVYKGASIIRFATFREILESPFSRKIIGFDAFGKFPGQEDESDSRFIEQFQQEGGDGISQVELNEALENKSIGNFELIRGDILETLPSYVAEHPELKIALLHIDVDVYRPSVVILEHLYKRVVKGGVIVFDDYGTVDGETKAVDEFFADKTDSMICKLPISHVPAYFIK